jgi:hypothetical protein
MISRRKTTNAVITRTIIDGSTVDMRESPNTARAGRLARMEAVDSLS